MDVADVSIYRLAEMYCHGEMTADEYFAEVERRAPLAVEQMIRDDHTRRQQVRRGS